MGKWIDGLCEHLYGPRYVKVYWPIYEFGDYIGPAHDWFAWYPVKTFDGRWKWLSFVWFRRVQKKSHLEGPDWWFWAYSDVWKHQ